jgi:hypothetical protein
MACSFESVIRQAGVRINAITGATPALLETAYTTSPLTTSQVVSPDFTLSVLKDTLLLVEEKLVNAVANFKVKEVSPKGVVSYRYHEWRTSITSQTASLAHKAALPSVDSSNNKIVGVYGSVFDASDNIACEEMALQDIRIAVRNANSWVLVPVYGYYINGNRIHHTRTNVVIDVCTYNRTTRATAIGTITDPILLPDAAEEAYVCGIISLLVRDDAFTAQSQIYRSYFESTLSGQVLAQAA